MTHQVVKHTPLLRRSDLSLESIEKSNISTLSKQVIVAAFNEPKIRDINLSHKTSLIDNPNKEEEGEPDKILGIVGSEYVKALGDIIAKTIWDSGIKYGRDEQVIIISNIIQELQENDDYKNLTISEVGIAFKRGVRKKYGDFFGINITTINVWLDAYLEETRPAAIARIPEILTLAEPTKKPEPTAEEKARLHKIWLNDIYTAYTKCCELIDSSKDKDYVPSDKELDFSDFNNRLYIAITQELKLVKLDKEEYKAIWKKAIGAKRKESRDNKNSWGRRIEIRAALDAISNGDKKSLEAFKPVARRMAIPFLFKKIKEAGIDFKKEIEKIKNTF